MPVQIGFFTFGRPLPPLLTDVFDRPPTDLKDPLMLRGSFCTTWLED